MRCYKRKSTLSSITPTERTVVAQTQPIAQQLAKNYLFQISNNSLMDHFDSCELHTPPKQPKLSQTIGNTTRNSFSASVKLTGGHRYSRQKRNLWGRTKQWTDNPEKRKLSPKAHYIDYGYASHKRNSSLEVFEDKSGQHYKSLMGRTVYVAEACKPPPVREIKLGFGNLIMYEELPPHLSHPKIWNDMKKLNREHKRRNLMSAGRRANPTLLDSHKGQQPREKAEINSSEVAFMISRFRQLAEGRKPNILNLELAGVPEGKPHRRG